MYSNLVVRDNCTFLVCLVNLFVLGKHWYALSDVLLDV